MVDPGTLALAVVLTGAAAAKVFGLRHRSDDRSGRAVVRALSWLALAAWIFYRPAGQLVDRVTGQVAIADLIGRTAMLLAGYYALTMLTHVQAKGGRVAFPGVRLLCLTTVVMVMWVSWWLAPATSLGQFRAGYAEMVWTQVYVVAFLAFLGYVAIEVIRLSWSWGRVAEGTALRHGLALVTLGGVLGGTYVLIKVGLVIAGLGWAVVVALAVVPARGRSTTQWVGAWVRSRVGAVLGWTRWQARTATGIGVTATSDDPDLPGVLAGIRVHEGPPLGAGLRRIAIVQDRPRRTWSAVAKVAHPGIGLSTGEERNRLGAGLGELLQVVARGEVLSQVAITVRTIPDDGAERRAWVAAHTVETAPGLSREVNDLLQRVVGPACVRSEVFVCVTATDQALAKPAREAGGGVLGRAQVLYSAMREVEAQLVGPVGASEVRWLTSAELAVAMRTGFAPGDRPALVAAEVAAETDPAVVVGMPLPAAGPSGAWTAPRSYTHDAWSSASHTLVLPSQGARMGALAPILAPTTAGERRSVTVFFPVVTGARAEGMVRRRHYLGVVGAGIRTKLQMETSTREQLEDSRTRGMDVKLVTGQALTRPAAVVTVTVPATWSVDEYRRRLEASIRGAGFVPQSLDLAQDSGFVAGVIPVGIGLPVERSRR